MCAHIELAYVRARVTDGQRLDLLPQQNNLRNNNKAYIFKNINLKNKQKMVLLAVTRINMYKYDWYNKEKRPRN